MENSFSLDFNPISTVKSVKDYEREINQLRAENFELKTRIAHSSTFPPNNNISKVLYEQNEKFSQLEIEKKNLEAQIEELKNAYNALKQENVYINDKYTQEIAINNEKIGLLEDENKRHIVRMEKFSKELNEIPIYKNKIQEMERENCNYKGFIEGLESEIGQLKQEYNQRMSEYEMNIRAVQEEFEKKSMKEKEYLGEIERLNKTISYERAELNNNKNVIEDLKNKLNKETKEKEEILLLNKKSKEILLKETQNYLFGMGKFKQIISGKLMGLGERLTKIEYNLSRNIEKIVISNENFLFIKKLGLEGKCFNDILVKTKQIIEDAHSKINLYKNEIKETRYFINNNKKLLNDNVIKLLEDFKIQFNEAKDELLVCKKYLIKKAEENKLLKNENSKLIREIKMANRIYSEKIIDPFSKQCIT